MDARSSSLGVETLERSSSRPLRCFLRAERQALHFVIARLAMTMDLIGVFAKLLTDEQALKVVSTAVFRLKGSLP
jgi:hypothetical protein